MAEKILIVDDDVETLRLVGLMLDRVGYKIIAADNGERAVHKAMNDQPDLVLLDVMMPDMSGYDVARQLRASDSTKRIPIIMFTAKAQVDDKVEGLESGADAYLTKPTQPRELLAQVKALLKRKESAVEAGKPEVRRGYMVGVLSAKGGLGVSSLSVNLGISIQKLTNETVLVADFRPGSGDIGYHFGYHNPNGLTQLLQKDPEGISSMDVKREVLAHQSGIQLLMSPQQPKDAVYNTNVEQFKTIARQLPLIAKYVLLDLGPTLPPLTQSVLEHCDDFIVVVEPTPMGVNQTKALMDNLFELGIGKGRIKLVLLNRTRSSLQMNWTEVQDKLGHRIVTVITPAPDLAYKSTEVNNPMVLTQPNSLTAEQYTKLANSLLQR